MIYFISRSDMEEMRNYKEFVEGKEYQEAKYEVRDALDFAYGAPPDCTLPQLAHRLCCQHKSIKNQLDLTERKLKLAVSALTGEKP